MAEAPGGDDTSPQHAEGGHIPVLRELVQLPVSPVWYLLGIQLGVSADDLDVIEKDYPGDTDMRKVKMFSKWLGIDTNPTYEKLIKALAAVGKRSLAESVCARQGISQSILDAMDAAELRQSSAIPASDKQQQVETDKLQELATIQNIDKTKKEIRAQSTRNIQTLNQAFNKMFEVLRSRKKSLLDEQKRIVDEKLKVLDDQQQKIQASIAKLEHKEEDMQQNSTQLNGVDGENEHCPKIGFSLEPAEIANIEVQVDCIDQLAELCEEQCKIFYSNLSVSAYIRASNCAGHEKTNKAPSDTEVGEKTYFTIHTTYPDGQPCQELQRVEVELHSFVHGSSSKVKVSNKIRGVYEACYCPTTRGRHQLSVKVNEMPIPGSPFSLFVTIHPSKLESNPVRVIDVSRPTSMVIKDEQIWVNEADEHEPKVSGMDRYGKRTGFEITDELLKAPSGLAVHGTDIYVTDAETHCLLKFDSSGQRLNKVGGKGSKPGQFDIPGEPLIIDERVFLSDNQGHRVQVFNKDLNYRQEFGSKGSSLGEMKGPGDLVYDETRQYIYLADSENGRIQVFTPEGKAVSLLGGILGKLPLNICLDRTKAFLFVSDAEDDCVSVWKIQNGELVKKNGSKGSKKGEFNRPTRIAFDSDGFLYVCDKYNNRIQVF